MTGNELFYLHKWKTDSFLLPSVKFRNKIDYDLQIETFTEICVAVSHSPFILSRRSCEDITYKNCSDMLSATLFLGVGSITCITTKQTINRLK